MVEAIVACCGFNHLLEHCCVKSIVFQNMRHTNRLSFQRGSNGHTGVHMAGMIAICRGEGRGGEGREGRGEG